MVVKLKIANNQTIMVRGINIFPTIKYISMGKPVPLPSAIKKEIDDGK
jgi:hypothetical protein